MDWELPCRKGVVDIVVVDIDDAAFVAADGCMRREHRTGCVGGGCCCYGYNPLYYPPVERLGGGEMRVALIGLRAGGGVCVEGGGMAGSSMGTGGGDA